jgi:hypothetical protein
MKALFSRMLCAVGFGATAIWLLATALLVLDLLDAGEVFFLAELFAAGVVVFLLLGLSAGVPEGVEDDV